MPLPLDSETRFQVWMEPDEYRWHLRFVAAECGHIVWSTTYRFNRDRDLSSVMDLAGFLASCFWHTYQRANKSDPTDVSAFGASVLVHDE